MFVFGDLLPLLQAMFPGQAGDAEALAVLADRLQTAATWRCARLQMLHPQGRRDSGSSGSGFFAPVGNSRPQAAVAHGDAAPLLLLLKHADSRIWVQPLAAGPYGLQVQHPQSVRVPSLHPLGSTAAITAVLACLSSGLLLLVSGDHDAASHVLHVPRGGAGSAAWLNIAGVRPPAAAAHDPGTAGGVGIVYLLTQGRSLGALDLTSFGGRAGSAAPSGSWRLTLPVMWPKGSQHLEPVALHVHYGQLLALCLAPAADGKPGQLQVWATPCPVPETGTKWQLSSEGCADLPRFEGRPDVRASLFQGKKWLVLLQPRVQSRCECSGGGVGAEETTGMASQPGRPSDEQADAGRALFIMAFDLVNSCWSGPHTASQVAAREVLQAPGQHRPGASSSGLQEPLGAAYFEEQARQLQEQPGAAAAAAATVAQAAAGALNAAGRSSAGAAAERPQRLFPESDSHGLAMFVDGTDSMIAVWQEWGAPLPPKRLGEIAAPASLPYSLRQAQQARAVAAQAATALAAGDAAEAAQPPAAAAAAAAAAGNALAAAADAGSSSVPGSSMGSTPSALQEASVLLRLAADPSLPPIACPLSAVQQCGELARLMELQDEGEAEGEAAAEGAEDAEAGIGGGSSSGSAAQPLPKQRQLLLVGVRPEEHAALRQLVRCLAGETHAGLLDAVCCLDVVRLADLLDARALLAECVAVLECIAPGTEIFAPLLALAEARQYHAGLQRLKLLYRHALAVSMLQGAEPLLRWAQHGLQAGVDAILEVCTEVAATWLPAQPGLWLGSPEGDLSALASPEWQAALREQPELVRPLLLAVLELGQKRLEAGEQPGGAGSSRDSTAPHKRARMAAPSSGPFQSAAVRPRPDRAAQRRLPAPKLAQALQQELRRLGRALPQQQAQQREQRTAQAFAEAEARALRQQ